MEKMNDLRDLLQHELQDLYSVEEQVIAALPKMIGKASNRELKVALKQHLKVTEDQHRRVEQLLQQMSTSAPSEEQPGLFQRLFRTRFVCEGMQGIIRENNKILSEDINPEVMDAAIIACAQKVEHYKICGYGTAKAYAEELGMDDAVWVLQQTLDEEYAVDRLMTQMAETRLNRRAELAGAKSKGNGARQLASGSGSATRAVRPKTEIDMAAQTRGGKAGSRTSGNSRGGAISESPSGTAKRGVVNDKSPTARTPARVAASSGNSGRGAGSNGRRR